MELDTKIAVIGLGYVGLPLAVELAKKYSVIGFDINPARVYAVSNGHDDTLEIDDDILKKILQKDSGSTGLFCTKDTSDIASCNLYIITVPTPFDQNPEPNLDLLIQ